MLKIANINKYKKGGEEMLSLFNTNNAEPFLKWAGGKRQLIDELEKRLPKHILNTKYIDTYIEPFIGGGSFFFHLKNNYKIKQPIIMDINPDLILAYKVVQSYPEELIIFLKELSATYKSIPKDERKEFYHDIRDLYNKQRKQFDYNSYNSEWITRTAYLIFLNRTCFNGLYRLNKNGEFNSAFGSYDNPKIVDEENIRNCSIALQDTIIIHGDFSKSLEYVSQNTFVYLDPPYRPISKTSSFTTYTEYDFKDGNQLRLFEYFKEVDKRKGYVMLSNSDPKNTNPYDNFFDDLYKDFVIERVVAKRFISGNPNSRKPVTELIIRNYQ